MTSVAFSMTRPSPTISRTPSNAVTSACADPLRMAMAIEAATAAAFNRRMTGPLQ
jgi:hypothetical protein